MSVSNSSGLSDRLLLILVYMDFSWAYVKNTIMFRFVNVYKDNFVVDPKNIVLEGEHLRWIRER